MSSPGAGILQHLITSTVRFRYGVDSWFFRRDADTESLLASLRAKAANKPCLVVGNGPSLNETPLDAFRNVTAIGMNKIDLLYPSVQWRPSMIVCVNNLVVRQHKEAFESSSVPVFLAWKCRWFLNRTKTPNIHYFKNMPTADFSRDVGAGVGSLSPTVTYSALQFAYHLHADPVILFGIDHRFDTSPQHSGIERRESPDANHFTPDYFRHGQYWGLPDLSGSERSYERAKVAFDKAGRRIVDATIGGDLTVFPKVSVDEAMKLAGVASHD